MQRNGLFILQKTKGFRFGLDAVILSDFAHIRPHDRVADLGTGTGILPLLLYGREPSAVFDAVELQKEMADAAARSVRGNGLEGKSPCIVTMCAQSVPFCRAERIRSLCATRRMKREMAAVCRKRQRSERQKRKRNAPWRTSHGRPNGCLKTADGCAFVCRPSAWRRRLRR